MTTPLLSTTWLRRCALALGALLGTGAATQAQTLNYAATGASTLVSTYTDLGTTGTVISMANNDDANSTAQNIGFTFNYNGTAFTQFVMNTNGLLRLGAAAPSSVAANPIYGQTPENGPVNSTNAADVNLLMPFNFDLLAGTGTPDYRLATTGTTGSRVCTIQWKNVADKTVVASAGSTVSLPTQFTNFSFQVKLYEGSNRIEFVYSAATVSTNNSLKYAVVGLKGSGNAAGQNVLAVKGSAFDWSTTTFSTGPQQVATVANAHNFRSTFPPDAGRTYRFDPAAANDAAVQVYTLGQVSQTFASPHAVQAAVTNLGSAALTSRTVTLTVTGANAFTATQTLPALAVGASTVLTFAGYPLTNLGTSTVTVTLPPDDVASNNTSSSQQVVSAGRLAYTDPASTAAFAGGLGSGAANSILYVKHRTNSAAFITTITPTFNLPIVGSTFQVQVYAATGAGGTPASTPLYTSATQTITTSTATTTVPVAVPSVAVNGDFFVATKQLTVNNQALAYQTESPLRTGTFFFSADGLVFTDLSTSAFPARLAIEATLSATAPCAAVTNLAAGSVTQTGATLSFTPATGISSYTVTYTPAGGTAQTLAATNSPVTLANLTPGTAYTVSVVTNCGGGNVSTAATTTFTTLTCPAVTALAASNVTQTGATLTFTPATGITSYTVTYTPAGGTAQTVAATGSPVTLAGLTPGTTYTVRVVTNCGAGSTSAAATTTFTTLTPCTAVTNLTAGSVTATGATLTFTPASGATTYTITYTPAGGTAQTVTVTGSPVTLAGLQAGKQYTVSIVTNCGGGQTSAVATTTFTTPAPAPTSPVVSGITSSGASIGFTAASGATSYTITYTPQGGTPVTVTVTAPPAALTGLTPNTAYTVTIVANYPGGAASSAATVSFTTLQVTAVRSALAGGELAVYPNPAHRAFTLSLPALGSARTAEVLLVNALGQVVSRQTITLLAGGTQAAIEATGLATGVYSVRVQAGGETAVVRLLLN